MGSERNMKNAIADRLALARRQAGLSQAQVAKMLDLHRPAISEIEAGRRNISATELAAMADIYGVSVEWLTSAADSDVTRDRIQLAARELSKLKKTDLETVLGLLSALKKADPK